MARDKIKSQELMKTPHEAGVVKNETAAEPTPADLVILDFQNPGRSLHV